MYLKRDMPKGLLVNVKAAMVPKNLESCDTSATSGT